MWKSGIAEKASDAEDPFGPDVAEGVSSLFAVMGNPSGTTCEWFELCNRYQCIGLT